MDDGQGNKNIIKSKKGLMKFLYKIYSENQNLNNFQRQVFDLSKDYDDKLSEMLDVNTEEEKVNIYFFYGDGCPHCKKEEEFLDALKQLEIMLKNTI